MNTFVKIDEVVNVVVLEIDEVSVEESFVYITAPFERSRLVLRCHNGTVASALYQMITGMNGARNEILLTENHGITAWKFEKGWSHA